MKELFKSVLIVIIIAATVYLVAVSWKHGYNPQEMPGIFYAKLQQNEVFRNVLTIGVILLTVGFFVYFRVRYHQARRKDEERESKIEQIEKGLDIVQQTLSGLHDLIGEQNNSLLAAMKGAGAAQSYNDRSSDLTSLADEIIRRLEERYPEIPFVQAENETSGIVQAEAVWIYPDDGENATYLHQYLVKDVPQVLKELMGKIGEPLTNTGFSDFSREVEVETVFMDDGTSAIVLLKVSYEGIMGSVEESDVKDDAEKVDKALLGSLQLLVSA